MARLLARTTELMLGEVGGKLLLGWRRLELHHEIWVDLADTVKVLKALPKILMQTWRLLCCKFSGHVRCWW